ncbi:ribosomal protein S3 [Culex quinquefasciatus]|uniref:Ribosomal protein S3 n=1 Tax=Culex quinquefasciatus TaxID=7176 RepID=B0X7Z9_CULQU|nr:ribosomal protein S3 [Culex quinquefasciatus]|eukprot:XP_001865771.1 ribosomal protein S3 [Culex quinquefasciatus]
MAPVGITSIGFRWTVPRPSLMALQLNSAVSRSLLTRMASIRQYSTSEAGSQPPDKGRPVACYRNWRCQREYRDHYYGHLHVRELTAAVQKRFGFALGTVELFAGSYPVSCVFSVPNPCNVYVDTATHHVLLRPGVLGVMVKTMLLWDAKVNKPLSDNISKRRLVASIHLVHLLSGSLEKETTSGQEECIADEDDLPGYHGGEMQLADALVVITVDGQLVNEGSAW